ncbi:MAG: AraC family transcriptional regulator, partial [Leptospiraceae bacterium]|nr:AraC family transcriptional regulator [Leptospiraceae bacterium]
IGQIIEFIFFFRSVLIRITDQDDLLKIYRIESANELRAAEKDQSTSHRLTAAEGDAALKRLHRAFDGDKVYRQEELSLMSLAEKIGLTRHELSELFNTRLNTTFYEFLSEHRIREAQTLLENDRSARVLDIAMAVGFNSKSTFNKEFRRVTGKSPTEFRDEK